MAHASPVGEHHAALLQTGGLTGTCTQSFLRLEMLVVSLIPCSQQQNHSNFPFFSKCQQCILYPEKVILLLHSLKVKGKQFYIRKRFKPEKRTGKQGGSCRESGYSAAAPHRRAFAARPQITRTAPATQSPWLICGKFVNAGLELTLIN